MSVDDDEAEWVNTPARRRYFPYLLFWLSSHILLQPLSSPKNACVLPNFFCVSFAISSLGGIVAA